MQFVREKLTGPFAKKFVASVAEHLGGNLQPVLAGGRQEIAKQMGITELAGCLGTDAELFIGHEGELFFYEYLPEDKSLLAGCASKETPAKSWRIFKQQLSQVLGRDSWSDCPITSPQFLLLQEDAEPLEVTSWDRGAVTLLQQEGPRNLLHRIAAVSQISLPEAAQGRSLFEVGAEVQKMDDLGIICREYEVYCKETRQKVSRVSSMSALDEAAGRGFRCFHCGRSISEEQIVQSLSVTPSGKRLAKPNMWLAYYVSSVLTDLGVNPTSILCRSENDYKNLDIFADVKGSLFMFSVQEERLNAGATFHFLSRARYFAPDFGFIVVPSGVCKESAKVLQESGDSLAIVDSLDKLSEAIKACIEEASSRLFCDFLHMFSERTSLDLANLVGLQFIGVPPQASVLPEEEIVPVAEIQAAPQSEIKPEVDEVKAEIPAPMEPVKDEVAPAVTIDIPSKKTKASVEVHAKEEPAKSSLSIPAPGKAEDKASEVVSALANSLPVVDVEKQASEERFATLAEKAKVVKKMLPDIYASDETDAITELVHGFSDIEGCSAMIAGSDGMAFIGSCDTLSDSEVAAAVQVDLLASSQDILGENDLGSLQELMLCTEGGDVELVTSEDELTLLLHSTVSCLHAASDDSPLNADLKNTLLSICVSSGDKVLDCFVTEGDAVLGSSSDDASLDSIGTGLQRLLSEAATSFAEELSLGEVQAVIATTDKGRYAIYRLKEEIALVCLLENDVNTEVWRAYIPGRLDRVRSLLD